MQFLLVSALSILLGFYATASLIHSLY